MKQFNPWAICPKCTSGKVTYLHRRAGEPIRVEDATRMEEPDLEFTKTHETLERRCVPCGFAWLERCADLGQVAAAEHRRNPEAWENAAAAPTAVARVEANVDKMREQWREWSADIAKRVERLEAELEDRRSGAIEQLGEQLTAELKKNSRAYGTRVPADDIATMIKGKLLVTAKRKPVGVGERIETRLTMANGQELWLPCDLEDGVYRLFVVKIGH